jgi:hypothetical protein
LPTLTSRVARSPFGLTSGSIGCPTKTTLHLSGYRRRGSLRGPCYALFLGT